MSIVQIDDSSASSLSTISTSLLHFAAEVSSHDCVRLLIQAGADVHETSRSALAGTPLHVASVCNDRHEAVRTLLAAGASHAARDAAGATPLLIATGTGSHLCMTALLDGGAAVDERFAPPAQPSVVVPLPARCTALILASARCDLWAVSLLLQRGANPAALTESGRTSLSTLFDHLFVHSADNDSTGDSNPRPSALDFIGEHVLYGASLDTIDLSGRTLLIRSVESGFVDFGAALLALGSVCPPTPSDPRQPPQAMLAEALVLTEGLLGALRAGPAAAAARYRQRFFLVAAGGGADPLGQQLRRLRSGAFAPGEAWWDEDPAARAPRIAAVLLDRVARAELYRECAEKAEAQAAHRTILALEHWQRCCRADDAAPAGAEDAEVEVKGTHPPAEQQRGAQKAAFAAAVCVRKWREVAAEAEAAKRSEREALAGLADALQRAEERAAELLLWAAQAAY